MKFISTLNNVFASIAILSLVAVSALTTLALNPSGFGRTAQVAGINEGEIVSNFHDLKFKDIFEPVPGVEMQLIKLEADKYAANLSLGSVTEDQSHQFIQVTNPNTVSLPIKVSVQLSTEVSSALSLNVSDGANSYRLHDSDLGGGRVVEFIVPANSSSTFAFEIEESQRVNFGSNASIIFEL